MTELICLWAPEGDAAVGPILQNVTASTPAGVSVAVPPGVGGAKGQLSYQADSTLGRALNEASQLDETADLVLVTARARLPAGWLEHLRSAAYSDDIVGAATALSDEVDSVLSQSEIDRLSVQAAQADPDPSGALRAYVAVLPPHCIYIRRSTLQLLGGFAQGVSDPWAVLAEFSARMIARGLVVSLASDVPIPATEKLADTGEGQDEEAVERRYPWLAAARSEQEARELGPLRRTLVATRTRGRPLSVTIDGRGLGTTGGTQTHIGGLVAALARERSASVRVIVRDEAPDHLVQRLQEGGIQVVKEDESAGLPRTDVAHRPQQAFVPEDLSLLRRLGERVVITHHDLIAFRNPAYHATPEEWRRFRRLTRLALGAADRVVFGSEHARGDAITEELIEPEWTELVGSAIESGADAAEPIAPPELDAGRPFIVMLGADYLHKNRLFALELMDQLRARSGWDGRLVFAGPHVPHGGSHGEEAEALGRRPELAADVVDLGPVPEAQKQWLLRHASALLCPSTYEGFGLTPLEAAVAEIPCLYAPLTSLKEVVGEEADTIVPWDPVISADRVLPLLTPGPERRRHLSLLAGAAQRHSWASVVRELNEVYRRAVASPYRSSVPRAWEELEREQLIVELDRARNDVNERWLDLQARVDHGLPLIDRGGLLTQRQQRGLMRIASRSWLRVPVLGPIGLLGRTNSSDRRSEPESPQP
ncbi:MAG TPA: glycosyltransferase [Solirubrobacteraceae bacterium]|nr:glycosyltransferase [Solirubrobacteraceae bacterium]